MTHGGDGNARVALYAPAARGALAPYLDLTVVRGTRAPDPSGACDGFTPDARDYGVAQRSGAIFHGRLSQFPDGEGERVVDPVTWGAGDSVGYRFELRLVDDPAAHGLRAQWDWRLGVEPLPATDRPAQPAEPAVVEGPRVPPPAACTTLTLPRGRRVVKTFRTHGGRRVVFTADLRSAGLRLDAGMRTRGGRTLRDPRWERLSWTVNGRIVVTLHRRPFRVIVPPKGLRPGRNVVVATIRPRVGEQQRLRFVVHAVRTGANGCAVR